MHKLVGKYFKTQKCAKRTMFCSFLLGVTVNDAFDTVRHHSLITKIRLLP